MTNHVKQKRCYKCGETKPTEEFNRNRRKYDGLSSECSACNRNYLRRYAKANSTSQVAKVRQWRMENPLRRSEHTAQERAAAWGAPGFFSWATALEIYGSRCAICDIDGPLSVDHIVPLSKGGPNWQFNIQPLCKSCNSRKSNKILL